jgi:hypothetical protein
MEEKEKYGIKDKSSNNSSSKEADTLSFILCLTLHAWKAININIEKTV